MSKRVRRTLHYTTDSPGHPGPFNLYVVCGHCGDIIDQTMEPIPKELVGNFVCEYWVQKYVCRSCKKPSMANHVYCRPHDSKELLILPPEESDERN